MKTFLLLSFFLIAFALKPEGLNGVERIIGAISDCNTRIGKEERVAMDMAIQDFNMQQNRTFIRLRFKCSEHKPLQAALAARHLINKNKVSVILGPRSWEGTSTVAEVSERYDVPILSFADSSPPWAAERWPFLVQGAASTFTQMKAVAKIIQSWGWRRANVIYEDTDSAANGISPYLYGALQEVDVQISNLSPLPSLADSSLLQKELEKLKKEQCRLFVVHTSLALATRIFGMAKEMEMMEKEYVWITTDSITSLVHSMNFSSISSMQGVIGVRNSYLETGHDFHRFSTRFLQIFGRKYPEEKHHEPGIFALQAYDAVWTVGLSMNQNQDDVNDGRKLLESILRTDIDGLSGKIRFTQRKLETATQFQIINIIGKGYRELGFWTVEGFSSSIDGGMYNSSMESLGHVIWPGGPWSTPRGWNLPTIENPLRIGVPNGSITNKFVEVHYDPSTNHYNFSGFSVDAFSETAKRLKYSLQHEFIPFGGNYTDLVKKVQSKEFDAAVGDIAIISNRCEYVEFTHPHTESGLVMVVPILLSHSNTAWLFVKPFTKAMWLLTLFINVFNGFVVWSIEQSYCSELRGPVLNQIGTLLWLAFATLFTLNGQKLHSNLSRMTTVVWLFVDLIIIQSYTASLTSMLTVRNLEQRIANIETLKSRNALIGYSQKSFVRGYLEGPLGFKSNNIRSFTTADEYEQALRSGEIEAAFLEAPVAKLFVAKYCKRFTIAGPTYQVGGYGFAFPKGSPLLPDIDEALLNVRENGVLKDLEERLIESEQCVDTQSDSETASLSPHNFFVLFIFTGGTSTAALLVYYFQATDRSFENSTAQYKGIWITIMVVLIKLGYHRNRLPIKVSDVAHENPGISPQNSHSRSQV